MALTSITQSRFASQVDITIEKKSGSLSASTSFKTKNIGTIERDHAIENLNVTDTSKVVLFDRGTFELSVFNIMDDGTKFFDVLLGEVAATDILKIECDFTTRAREGISSRSFTDSFFFTTQDLTLSKDGFEVKIKANSDFSGLSETVYDYIDGSATNKTTYAAGGGVGDLEAVVCGDFIDDMLARINPTASDYILSTEFGDRLSSYTTTGTEGYLLAKVLGNSQTVQSALLQMGAVDGAIIGSGIGYAYYSTRSNVVLTTLSTSDIVKDSLTRINKRNQYRGISVNLKNTSLSLQNYNYESESPSIITVSSNTDSGEYVIPLSTSASGTIFSGDIIYFGDNSSPAIGDNRQVYEVDDVNGSNLTLKKPLASSLTTHDTIFKLTTYNYAATKAVSLHYTTAVMVQGEYNATTSKFDPPASQFTGNPTNTGKAAYEGAYGAEGQGRLILVVDGIDKVKPYTAITLDSSFDSGVAGTYIIARWKADLNKDTMELELHEP